ncbi:MAG: hypothetical protein ACKO32_01525, partial [Planctomycetia bacterium]
PMFLFQQLDRAHVTTATKETIQLVGGGELRLQGGPVLLESLRADLMRVLNQSKNSVEVAYRDALITLDPGEKVDLPVVGSEGLPKAADSAWKAMEGTGFPVRTRGALETGSGSDPLVSPGAASTGGLSTGASPCARWARAASKPWGWNGSSNWTKRSRCAGWSRSHRCLLP